MSSKVKAVKPAAKPAVKPSLAATTAFGVRPEKPRHPPLDRALFVFDGRLKDLEELLYGHIINAIDFPALDMLEQHASWLIDQ
ncbi:MAG: hypothetical protein H0T89_04590, partial [Deltaproteobacteria bacterium]|nr:hypothetical protein [Deltaproteobacteria bacterium]